MTLGPTLGLAQAADLPWDVIVVGAGPAGSLVARELARGRARVLLLDRASFPRFKVCGCCLNLRALATLGNAGLGGLAARLGAVPLQGMRLAAGNRQTTLALPGGVVLSREAFDMALVQEAIQAGAAFLPETRASLGESTPIHRCLVLRQGHHYQTLATSLVLAAAGLGSGFLTRGNGSQAQAGSRLGAGTIAESAPSVFEAGTIFMACGSGGYVGLVRLEDGRLDVAAAFEPNRVKEARGLGRLAEWILAEAGLPAIPGLASLPWRGTPLLTRRLARPASYRMFALGDAAGYVEPFTGEGLAWALAGATALAPLALRACRLWEPGLERAWIRRYRQIVARRQWLCRGVAALLRRPALMRLTVTSLAHAPVFASPMIHYLNKVR